MATPRSKRIQRLVVRVPERVAGGPSSMRRMAAATLGGVRWTDMHQQRAGPGIRRRLPESVGGTAAIMSAAGVGAARSAANAGVGKAAGACASSVASPASLSSRMGGGASMRTVSAAGAGTGVASDSITGVVRRDRGAERSGTVRRRQVRPAYRARGAADCVDGLRCASVYPIADCAGWLQDTRPSLALGFLSWAAGLSEPEPPKPETKAPQPCWPSGSSVREMSSASAGSSAGLECSGQGVVGSVPS